MNEGCADLAMYLNGYGHPEGHVQFFLDHAENSLVQWGDQSDLEILADYGNAYLWTLYLKEQYGQAFVREMGAPPWGADYIRLDGSDAVPHGVDVQWRIHLERRWRVRVTDIDLKDSAETGSADPKKADEVIMIRKSALLLLRLQRLLRSLTDRAHLSATVVGTVLPGGSTPMRS